MLQLEGDLFILFKKLCHFLDIDKQQLQPSIQNILDIKNETKNCIEEIIKILLLQPKDTLKAQNMS